MSTDDIVIVDYGLGNLFNVVKAFSHLNVAARISSDPEALRTARSVVLPGVGAFEVGMAGLQLRSLIEPLKSFAASGRPLLGICLGMQMLMDESFEMGRHQGLGIIRGRVEAFPERSTTEVKIPHMGWNAVESRPNNTGPLFFGTELFYFVHGYIVRPEDDSVPTAITTHGQSEFCSMLTRGNVHGCQFHPEKSSTAGLSVLRAFSNL